MSGTGARRHCAACDREVIDLSVMHAEAAIDALITREGKACIRYRTDAAGEIQFAPPPARRSGLIATATLALTACAGWAEEPAAVPPGELGMCIPDADDPNVCDRPDLPLFETQPRGPSPEATARPVEAPRDSSPEATPDPTATSRDYTALIDQSPTVMGDSAGVRLVDPSLMKEALEVDLKRLESDGGITQGFLVILVEEPDLSKSLFDRESTAGPGLDWWATAELLRMKRQLRREERLRRREARRR
jgi:hypothetical protein